MKYELKKELKNGDQEYMITLKRVKFKVHRKEFNSWFGYDSFYPPYSQNEAELFNEIKTQVTISKTKGEAKIDLVQGPLRQPVLSQVSPRRNLLATNTFSRDPITATELTLVTGLIFNPVKKASMGEFQTEFKSKLLYNRAYLVRTKIYNINNVSVRFLNDLLTLVPSYIDLSKSSSILLTDASFKLPPNAVVKGKIINSGPDKRIKLFDDQQSSTLNTDYYPNILKEEFESPVRIKYISENFFYINDNRKICMVKPGDTLSVYADMKNIESTFKFSGNAAKNSELLLALQPVLNSQDVNGNQPYLQQIKSAEEFEKFTATNVIKFKEIIAKHQRKVDQDCLSYCINRWNFTSATSKLYFLFSNGYKAKSASEIPFQDFPKDFFTEIDTLSITMNDYQETKSYKYYYEWYLPYLRARMQMTGATESDFFENYATAQASLKGYPLYHTLHAIFMDDIPNLDWTRNEAYRAYLQQFLSRCRDTSLTKVLKENWAENEKWKPGNESPIRELKLANGSTFDLMQFKGKPVCFILAHTYPEYLNAYLEFIKKSKIKDIQYVIAQINSDIYELSSIDSQLLKQKNVTYLEINDSGNTSLFHLKCSVFDKWMRVIDNNIQIKRDGEYYLNSVLQKARTAERYSPQQKAELIKTTGWSLGSVLVTGLIGAGIYRRRVQRVKKEEAVKRQIKDLEVKAIRSQMNPHFVFNALNSIQSLINAKQFKEANIYLAKFAVLLRGVLNSSEKNFVSLSEEIEAVKLYCELEQLRFDFKLIVEIDGNLKPELIEIPGMIIQPLAENAIVHGLAPKAGSGLLTIKISKQNFVLKISVSDNGAGFRQRKTDALSQKGFGLKLVEERLKVLNYEGKPAELKVSANPDAGTTAAITIPATA